MLTATFRRLVDNTILLSTHPPRQRIAVPRSDALDSLKAIHTHFIHPPKQQTNHLFRTYFFSLDFDTAIDVVSPPATPVNS